jgi:predicted XRE-type DNA-binding protein
MPNANRPGHVTRGDIFDDLGLSPEEAVEAKVKADIWRILIQAIERRHLDQARLSSVLKIHQPDASNLLRGKLSKFSTGKLIQFAVRLNLQVHVQLKEPKVQKGVMPSITAAKSAKKNRELAHA